MAAFCGTCGKPIVGDVQFCGGRGARTGKAGEGTIIYLVGHTKG